MPEEPSTHTFLSAKNSDDCKICGLPLTNHITLDPRGDTSINTLENGQPNIIDYSNNEPLLYGSGENSSHDYPGKIIINNESRYIDREVKRETIPNSAETGKDAIGSDTTQPTLPTGAPLPDHNMSGFNFNQKIKWNESIKINPISEPELPVSQAFSDAGNNPHNVPTSELDSKSENLSPNMDYKKLGKSFNEKSDTGDDLTRTGPGGGNTRDNYNLESYHGENDVKLNIATPYYDDRKLHDVSGIIPELQTKDDKIKIIPNELQEDIQINKVYSKDEEDTKNVFFALIAAGLISMGLVEFFKILKSNNYKQLNQLKKMPGGPITQLKPYDFLRFQYSRQEDCPICRPLDKLEFWAEDPKRPIVPNENLGKGVYNTHPNCWPGDTVIENPDGVLSAMRIWYDGSMIEITLTNGKKLTVTPNHMFLTPQGFVCADLLYKGDNVIYRTIPKRKPSSIHPNNNRKPTSIQEIFNSLRISKGSSSRIVPTSTEYLHGDAKFSKSDIDVIWPNRFLRFTRKAFFFKHRLTSLFNFRNPKLSFLSSNGSLTQFLYASLHTTNRRMSSSRISEPFFLSRLRHTENLSISTTSQINSFLHKSRMDSTSTNTELITKSLQRFSSLVETQQIIDIKVNSFHGYVYDIQTPSSLYFANNTLVSNCKCDNIKFIKLLSADESPKSSRPKSKDARESLAERKRITDEYLRPLNEALTYENRSMGEFNWVTKKTVLEMKKHAKDSKEGRFILAVVSGESFTDHRIEGVEKYRRHWTEDEMKQNIRTGKGKLLDINHLLPKKDPYSGGIFDANWNDSTKKGEMILFESDLEILNAIRNDIITDVSINTGAPRIIELNCNTGECLLEPQGTSLGNDKGIALSYVVTSPQGFKYNGKWLYPLKPGMKFTKLYIIE